MSTPLTTLFGEHPDVLVMEFLAAHADFDYNVTDLARNAGISRPTAYKVVGRLRRARVLRRTRRVGTSWFYQLDEDHPLVRPLLDADLLLSPREEPKRRRAPRRVRA